MNYFITVLSIIVVLFLLFLILIKYLFNNPVAVADKTPGDMGIHFSEIRFPTKNNRQLYGWWIPATADTAKAPTLILVHGWGRNAGRMLPFVEHLSNEGYNFLAFDARHHGKSDRDGYATMLKFAEDIISAVDFAVNEQHADPALIYVLGHSIGGAASIYAAAHDGRIQKVIAIGAFAHPGEIMKNTMAENHIPKFLRQFILSYVEKKIGKTLEEIAPQNNIAKIEKNVLLIHGTADKIVPFSQAEINFACADKNLTELWPLDDRGHSDYIFEENFWPRVKIFLKNITPAA